MIHQPNWKEIEKKIAESSGTVVDVSVRESAIGGSINQSFMLKGPDKGYFVKLNQAHREDMFSAEYEALNEIQSTQTVRVPRPYCFGVVDNDAFIAMELLSIGGNDRAGASRLGQELASMHRVTQSQFGWHRNNTIGSTLQENSWMEDWGQFWLHRRLLIQLALAAENGFGGSLQRRGDKLAEKTTQFFDHNPDASLLHGDLWSGNFSILKQGGPAIYDPALYYGDRETDIAMSELFGGFSADFYRVYHEVYPLNSGYSTRKILYNLYHILNHLNLFGSSYLHQAEDMIERLLSEV
mgnify:CR=1 FL=1